MPWGSVLALKENDKTHTQTTDVLLDLALFF